MKLIIGDKRGEKAQNHNHSSRSVIALTLRMRDWLAEFLRGAQWPLGDNTRPGFSHSNSFGIRCEKGTDNGRSSIL